MFTVNEKAEIYIGVHLEFQNISCLRLIKKGGVIEKYNITFQNISCLRLI